MTIQVFTYNEHEEKALLDFLKNGHYNYKSTNVNELAEPDFLRQYNKDLDEAEAQMDAGEYLTHDEVKNYLANRRKRSGEG
ncbi:hypothetical protein HQ865_19710 [Mucilaginibacter mali]|uniref:Uncharacterized protein n=1 Tax=Mucilaginibacter mali TaxID=2740462 RepID=A0A7D4TWZ3_9SPHI|nr:hypothetical protein [Mucilaginibacter mali]QKJ31895.1 hypothetical protein HQ865_19710 [Mucilaginibacter mali]